MQAVSTFFLIEDDMEIMHEGAFRDYIIGSKKNRDEARYVRPSRE